MSIFSSEPTQRHRRTRFNLSHEVKTTMKFGQLTPILCREVLPGDTWRMSNEHFIRFAPLLSPVMHRINVFTHYYFVPFRLIMEQWEEFIMPNGLSEDERPEKPYLTFKEREIGYEDVADYQFDLLKILVDPCNLPARFGIHLPELPEFQYSGETITNKEEIINSLLGLKIDLFPFLCYWRIIIEYYLDENLPITIQSDGYTISLDYRSFKKRLDEIGTYGEWDFAENQLSSSAEVEFFKFFFTPFDRAFEKDYFTSALPTTQRGGEVMLGGLQTLDAKVSIPSLAVDNIRLKNPTDPSGLILGTQGDQHGKLAEYNPQDLSNMGDANLTGDTETTEVDVTDSEGNPPMINPVTINELRRASKLQEFLELSMRGGYRFIEQLKAIWGVISDDARLDRPEYLGGHMAPVTVSELSSTTAATDQILGEYSGHAQSYGSSNFVKRRFKERGFIICLVSVLPRTSYCQGIDRQFLRFDRFDYAYPQFAHLGEQPVFNCELFASADDPFKTFGYQSRYAEYKSIPSQVSGEFVKTLNHWTMVRQFQNLPTLSPEFVYCDEDGDDQTKIFTVQDGSDYLYCEFMHHIVAKKQLPKYGTPML